MKRLIPLLLLAAIASHAADRKVLVYTRNFTPDGDASDDPAVFTDANLKQYQAIIFSNSNNLAFTNQAQRDAFKKCMESGGGFVGIHSASGSEQESK